MFRRQPNLHIDVAFRLNSEKQKSLTLTMRKVRENLQENYKLAIEHSEKTTQRNKQRCNLKVRESILEEGDSVLLKNVSLCGKHKLADRWSRHVYKVAKHIEDSPVYIIAPITSNGSERALHRDLLFSTFIHLGRNGSGEGKREKAQTHQASELPQDEGGPE